MFEAEGFLFFPHSPLFHFKDGGTRQRLLLPWEVRSGFLCVPRTGANVPMLLLYSALEQAWNTVWLLHVCLPKTRALITQSNDTTFGFALSIVLTFLSNTLGTDSPFAPYLFLRKAAFQHFDEAKKDGISHTARFVKGACPNQCKRGLLQGRPLPVVYTSQRHFCLFLPSRLSRPPASGWIKVL